MDEAEENPALPLLQIWGVQPHSPCSVTMSDLFNDLRTAITGLGVDVHDEWSVEADEPISGARTLRLSTIEDGAFRIEEIAGTIESHDGVCAVDLLYHHPSPNTLTSPIRPRVT